jgi:EAL domain-containing protein (putative c-di-GMP-specific phosphodiesterase class I)
LSEIDSDFAEFCQRCFSFYKFRDALDSFADQSLPNFIENCFKAAAVGPERVIFEITETSMISNLPAARCLGQAPEALQFWDRSSPAVAGQTRQLNLQEIYHNY